MTISISISKPILNFEGDQTTTLEFEEPTFADLIEMEEKGGKELKQMFTLMKSCSTYSEKELKKLSPADALKCGTELLSFLAFPDVTTKKNAK